MKETIQKEIERILKELGIENPRISFDFPSRMEFGDLSTNAAMVHAKEIGIKPVDLANQIKEKLRIEDVLHLSRVDVILPGFINFFFDADYFGKVIDKASSDSHFGENTNLSRQKISIEYTVTNVLKPMHIGHLMGNVIGESLSRIIENSGAEVKRNNYQGDSGLHIAKAVWGIRKLEGKIEGTVSEKAEYIGNSYVVGAEAYDDDEVAQKEIKEINKKIFEKSDTGLLDIYQWGRQASLEHFEELYKKLGTKFDFYFFESEVVDDALKIVREFLKKGVFEESQGAVVFHGEKYDPKLHTRVFITSDGLPMYEAKDIAHAIRKYEAYKFDASIIVTANEQNEYFKVMLRTLQEINPEIARKTKHVSHGILKLPSGKMSSRKGNVITGEELIASIEQRVFEVMNSHISPERSEGINRDKAKATIEEVAVGAIKYSILRQAIGGDIIFDFDKSLSFEGDSGPYLQYATVRANSILKKAEGIVSSDTTLPSGWMTTSLERILARFPDVVEKAEREYAPHYIVTYLIELSGEFNSFYATHKIIDANDATSSYRLALTEAFANVMTKGLDLLGVKVPSQM